MTIMRFAVKILLKSALLCPLYFKSMRFVRSKYPLFDAVWSFLLKRTACIKNKVETKKKNEFFFCHSHNRLKTAGCVPFNASPQRGDRLPNIAFGDVRQCKGKTFLHRLLYITEGYVCDVWQCITPKG